MNKQKIKVFLLKWLIRWVGLFQNIIGIISFCSYPKTNWMLYVSKWYAKETHKLNN